MGKPITIGDNVWLDVEIVVCKGVTIGNNVVAGVRSVIIKETEYNVVAVSNPAKEIRKI